jgi:hypothetical protein
VLTLLIVLVEGCVAQPSPSPSVASATQQASASQFATEGSSASQAASPTASPEPALSLELPKRRDDRRVRVSVASHVKADEDGTIDVTVENLTDSRIDEIVLRWPSALDDALMLAPFTPTRARVREGGRPLHFEWTRWVVGPGELGEPAGTISLGWGPLLPGATLSIPLVANRRTPGAVAFDLQLLAGVRHTAPVRKGGDALLSDPDGNPAVTRVEVD